MQMGMDDGTVVIDRVQFIERIIGAGRALPFIDGKQISKIGNVEDPRFHGFADGGVLDDLNATMKLG